ncbi:MAG: zinc finger domain-containing protein [Microbacterium sp.]
MPEEVVRGHPGATGCACCCRRRDRSDDDDGRPRCRGVPAGDGAPRRPPLGVPPRAGLPCRVCGTEIVLEEMASRTLYWCPSCQKRRAWRCREECADEAENPSFAMTDAGESAPRHRREPVDDARERDGAGSWSPRTTPCSSTRTATTSRWWGMWASPMTRYTVWASRSCS